MFLKLTETLAVAAGDDFVSPLSIPAVLCSNHWSSEVSVVNEPSGLNQAAPPPLNVHPLPDFDQDSWTLNPPHGLKKTPLSSSGPSQTQEPINNNSDELSATSGKVLDHVTSRRSEGEAAASEQPVEIGATTGEAEDGPSLSSE